MTFVSETQVLTPCLLQLYLSLEAATPLTTMNSDRNTEAGRRRRPAAANENARAAHFQEQLNHGVAAMTNLASRQGLLTISNLRDLIPAFIDYIAEHLSEGRVFFSLATDDSGGVFDNDIQSILRNSQPSLGTRRAARIPLSRSASSDSMSSCASSTSEDSIEEPAREELSFEGLMAMAREGLRLPSDGEVYLYERMNDARIWRRAGYAHHHQL